MVIVADGTPEAAKRIERVLWNDPATGVMRHADAGYETAIDCARDKRARSAEPGEVAHAQSRASSFGIVVFAPSMKVWTASRTIASRSAGIGVS